MALTGRFRWKDLTAVSTPDSDFILCAIDCAAMIASPDKQKLIASDKLSVVNLDCGMGDGPAPAAAIMFPQNG